MTRYVAIACLAVSSFVALSTLLWHARVWQLVGPESYVRCRALATHYRVHAPRLATLRAMGAIALAVGAALLLVRPPWRDLGRSWPGCLLFMMGLTSWAQQAMPGTVVLLGTTESTHLQHVLRRRLFPLRVVSLLRIPERGLRKQYDTSGDDLRLRAGDDWRAVVGALITECPLVVIDVRQRSPFVVEELGMVRSKLAGSKAVCLLGERSGVEIPSGAAAVFDEQDAIALLEEVATGRAPMPNPEMPLGDRSFRAATARPRSQQRG